MSQNSTGTKSNSTRIRIEHPFLGMLFLKLCCQDLVNISVPRHPSRVKEDSEYKNRVLLVVSTSPSASCAVSCHVTGNARIPFSPDAQLFLDSCPTLSPSDVMIRVIRYDKDRDLNRQIRKRWNDENVDCHSKSPISTFRAWKRRPKPSNRCTTQAVCHPVFQNCVSES